MTQVQAQPEDQNAIAVSDESFAHLPTGLDLCYQTFGDRSDPTVLLIMGLGGPMGWWSAEFCTMLAARGLHVVRFDNRDTGRSTKLRHHEVGRMDIVKAFLGRGTAPYGIADLADDAIALLDEIDVDAAHLVGASMGAMIAQTIAIDHPERVRSLVSIMSTTGRRTVGWTDPRVMPMMLSSVGRTRPEYADNAVKNAQSIASPAFPTDETVAYARALETYDRGWVSSGVRRHMLAVLTQPDRTERLAAVSVPTHVVHGTNDPLVHKSGGRATAEAIDGAQYLEIAGMGHDLPAQLYATFIDTIVKTAARAS